MKILHKIAVIILAVFMGITYCYPTTVRAENMKDFDKTSIDEDMADINVLLYPKNLFGSPRVIMVQEYCYTVRKNLIEYYALYVYVYNPTETEIETDKNNVVNMAVSYGTDGKPSSYENVKLIYLDKNANNRFYKFKIENPLRFLEIEKSYMEKHGKRRYDIAGIQLYHIDGTDSIDNTIATTYYFTGFGEGCGADYNAESTLECNEEVLETLSLTVTPTQFRPGNTNGKDAYTRDSLHSVFFSVPNKNLEESGGLWGFKAEWLDAVLKPALVTGNQDAYTAILDYLGKDIGTHIDDLAYSYVGNYSLYGISPGQYLSGYCRYNYDILSATANWPYKDTDNTWGIISSLYLMFYSGSAENSADSYVVSSEEIIAKAKESVSKYGGELVNDKYSKNIFESVASEYTVVELNNDDNEFNLESGTLTKNFWQKLFGGTTYVPDEDEFDHLKVVVPVTSQDISDLSDEEVSDTFCVGLCDVSALRKAVEKAESNDETVHLLRYQVTDYKAIEADLLKAVTVLTKNWDRVDTNAYFFQETVNLDFEVIELKFKKEDDITIIPIVMSPIDIFPSADPPVVTTNDSKGCKNLMQVIFGVVGVLLLLIILKPILPYIVQGVVWIITLPFKAIKKLINGSKK